MSSRNKGGNKTKRVVSKHIKFYSVVNKGISLLPRPCMPCLWVRGCMHLHIHILRPGEGAGIFFNGSMPYYLETRCLTEPSAAHHCSGWLPAPLISALWSRTTLATFTGTCRHSYVNLGCWSLYSGTGASYPLVISQPSIIWQHTHTCACRRHIIQMRIQTLIKVMKPEVKRGPNKLRKKSSHRISISNTKSTIICREKTHTAKFIYLEKQAFSSQQSV